MKRNNIGFGEIGQKLRGGRKGGRERESALETADITWTDGRYHFGKSEGQTGMVKVKSGGRFLKERR